MRVTIVQYGDYRDAAQRFADGGDENYAGQLYSVDWVRRLSERVERVSMVCVTVGPYEETLPNGIRVIGRKLYDDITEAELVTVVAAERPTHLIVRSPLVPLLRWGLSERVQTLPMLATSFPRQGLKSWYRYRRLAALLNQQDIRWVGNHNRNSARALVRIGVDAAKVVPWDFPPRVTPRDFAVKRREDPKAPLRLFYAGQVRKPKGVGDLIQAIALLKAQGREVRLAAAGAGDVELFQAQARELGVSDRVEFLGLIPNPEVVQHMHRNDAVVVPSQHSYPEGLPLTIYETYCSRSPLIASDHPMFRDAVVDGVAALVFPAGNAAELARCIARVADEPLLYAKLSENSLAAWEKLQIPVRWGDFQDHWLQDSEEDRRWLAAHSIASGIYA